MSIDTICIGVAIFFTGVLIASNLYNINDTLKLILKRYAALENLGLFSGEENDD